MTDVTVPVLDADVEDPGLLTVLSIPAVVGGLATYRVGQMVKRAFERRRRATSRGFDL